MSWTDAREHCNLQNAELASIHSQEENEFVLQLGRENYYNGNHTEVNGMEWTWLGGSDSKTEGLYLWTDQSPWTYINWRKKEPNDNDGTQDCIMMRTPKDSTDPSGTWSVYRCNYNSTFICKLKRTD